MADEQTPAAAPAVEATTDAGDAAAAAAPAQGGKGRRERSEPKKIVEKPEPVTEPSEADKNKAIEACKGRIAAAEKRLTDIKNTLDRLTDDRKSQGDTSGALRAELKSVREAFTTKKGERDLLFAAITKAKDDSKAAQQKLRDIQRSVKVSSVEDIDAQIARIEYEMSTSTLTLKDEKSKMLEIKNLRASREQVKALQGMTAAAAAAAAAVSTDPEVMKANQEKLKALEQEISATRAREKEIIAQLDAIREKYAASTGGQAVPELLKERKALQKQNADQRAAMRTLEQTYQQQAFLFRKFQREMREWKRQQDDIKYQELRKEREERKKEREKEDDDSAYKVVAVHPWADEIFTCDDLIKFCKSHVPKKETQSVKKTFDPTAGADKGLIPAGKKTIKDEDIEFAGTKKGKKGAAAAAAASSAAAPVAEVDKKLKLSIDAYNGFLKVGVEAPTLVSQCAATIQALQQAKTRFQRMTEADKTKAKAEAAAVAAKAKEDAKKVAKARSAGATGEGVPAAAEVTGPTIDYRKAIRGVAGAHV